MKNRGYTLVELMVVFVIIAILIGIILASVDAARRSARDNDRLSDIKTLRLKLETYHDEFNVYPATLSQLVTTGIISAVPTPPAGGPESAYQYAGLSVPGDSSESCTAYHLGITFEGGNSALQDKAGVGIHNDTNSEPNGETICSGSASDFDGTPTQMYDVENPI